MTPERDSRLLRAVLTSMDTWLLELEEIDRRHPGAAGHLLAVIRQARMSLAAVMQQAPPGD